MARISECNGGTIKHFLAGASILVVPKSASRTASFSKEEVLGKLVGSSGMPHCSTQLESTAVIGDTGHFFEFKLSYEMMKSVSRSS